MTGHKGNNRDLIQIVGKNIRFIRKSKNLTLKQLGTLINSHDEHLSKLENGRINPSLVYLIKLADALGVDVRELFK